MPAMFGGDAPDRQAAPEKPQCRPVPVAPQDQGSRPPQEIDIAEARRVDGPPTPPPPPPQSAEELQWKQRLASSINLELNIYHSCFMSVRKMTADIIASQPLDAADVGSSMEKPTRSPLEIAEPQIAIEVYRQVRRNMREEERQEKDGLTAALRKILGKAAR